jgi:uncharacterized protein (TIGR03437 family)
MKLSVCVSEQAGQTKTYRQSVTIQSLSLAFLLVLLASLSLKAATLPAGFTETQVTTGLSNPTAMAFAPDGRLFITQQGGQLRVIKNGTLLPTPFLTVPVDSSGERGLLGIAFDPNFAANQFVYVYYTATTSATHNRVSRFTANGDVAVAGSEVVILDLNNLSGATNHNGGALHFGPDGKLYIATGENAQPLNSQTLNNLLGKILRINSDGTIPTDNPFFNIAAGVNRAIWALGLRNPYTFAFQSGTSRMFINDVGQSAWEEINDGIGGSNYGWPNSEGATSNPNYRTPLFSYAHGGPTSTTGCAITGGAFYNPAFSQYPSQFVGKYFFADFCNGWIRLLDPSNNTASDFASGIASPVDLQIGPDGLLYYLARGNGAVFRINFPANQPPSIGTHPLSQSVAEGQPATFSVNASGNAPLSFQWQRNNVNITGANSSSFTLASASLADNGAKFKVVVTNSFGSVTSNEATLTVIAAAVHLTMTNSASFRGSGTKGGLASIQGTGLTNGLSGSSESDAAAHGVRVTIAGNTVPVLSYNNSQINIYVPEAIGTGVRRAIVFLNNQTIAADDVLISNDNPGLFTTTQNGAGEAIALLVSAMQYLQSPFNATTDGQPTVIALFGTGWRNSLPVSVTIGGQAATVEYAGPGGAFNGLDQINVRVPNGVTGPSTVVVTTASGAVSRSDVVVTFR